MKMLIPVFLFFGTSSSFILLSHDWLHSKGLDSDLLTGGNIFLFLLCMVSFVFLRKSIVTASPQIFIRNFYLSFLVKFMLVAVTVLIYAKTRNDVNRLSVIVCMALYLVYTFIEVRIILKESKKQNAK